MAERMCAFECASVGTWDSVCLCLLVRVVGVELMSRSSHCRCPPALCQGLAWASEALRTGRDGCATFRPHHRGTCCWGPHAGPEPWLGLWLCPKTFVREGREQASASCSWHWPGLGQLANCFPASPLALLSLPHRALAARALYLFAVRSRQ